MLKIKSMRITFHLFSYNIYVYMKNNFDYRKQLYRVEQSPIRLTCVRINITKIQFDNFLSDTPIKKYR